MNLQWTEEFPTSPGHYWFFGELSAGSMGMHYFPNATFKGKMYLVEVWEVGDGSLIAVVNGRMIYNNKFDKDLRREGYLGYWAAAEIPSPPRDVAGHFKVNL